MSALPWAQKQDAKGRTTAFHCQKKRVSPSEHAVGCRDDFVDPDYLWTDTFYQQAILTFFNQPTASDTRLKPPC
jgi:hypothetical protein